MKICSHCKTTENETRIIFWRNKFYLCNRHRIQMERHGRYIEHTRYEKGNPIKNLSDGISVKLFDKNGFENGVTIVDVDQYHKIKNKRVFKYGKYAAIQIRGRKIMLHRYLMGHKSRLYIDHIDGDRLNNRISNLRWSTIQENNFNSKVPRGVNKRRGVSFCKRTGKYMAYIEINGERSWLGRHKNYDDALRARVKKEKELYREYAPNT